MYRRCLPLCCAVAVLSLAAARPAAGAVFTLSDLNSTVQIDTTDAAIPPSPGVFSWEVDGLGQAFELLWFVSVDGGPRTLLNSLPVMSASAQNLNANPGNDKLTALYMYESSLHLTSVYQLTGGTGGSQASNLVQSLTVENLTAGPLDLQLFAYADFDVGGDTFDNVAAIVGPSSALQTFGTWAVAETVSPSVSHSMVGASPDVSILIEFTNDDLDGTAGPILGDGTYAFQWNVSLGAGQTVVLGRNADVSPVPEPGSVALLATMAAVAGAICLFRRRNRRLIE